MLAHTGEFPSHGSTTGSAPIPLVPTLKVAVAALVVGLGTSLWSSADRAAPDDDTRARTTSSVGAGVYASLGRRPSHNDRYSVEVVEAGSMAVGVPQSWIIHVAGRMQRRVAHAGVSVEASMPETGERSPAHPSARYLGHGDYRLDGLCFSRPGWWNVALLIDGRAGADSVAFNVTLPPTASAVHPAPRCGE